MDSFYAYIVDQNGHVLKRIDLAFENEEAHDVELWQLDRKITEQRNRVCRKVDYGPAG
jgi:hypothetical protein